MNILSVYGGMGRDCNLDSFDLEWWVHGSNATLICDGKYVGSVEEERFTRIKLDGNFPQKSIDYLLDTANIEATQVDIVVYVVSACHADKILVGNGYYYDQLTKMFDRAKIINLDHHLSHAATSFYGSGYENANVFTFDGGGNHHQRYNAFNASTFWLVDQYGDKWINACTSYSEATLRDKNKNEFSFGSFYTSCGYTIWTLLGGKPIQRDTIDGKVMGMCAYGDYNNLIDVLQDPFDLYHTQRASNILPTVVCDRQVMEHNHQKAMSIKKDKFDVAADFASWAQHIFEKNIIKFLEAIPQDYRLPNLCLAGGCALNILANSKIADSGLYDNVFVHPATGDDGLSFGAAMYIAKRNGVQVSLPNNLATVGPQYSDRVVKKYAHGLYPNHLIHYTQHSDEEIYEIASQHLADNKIVAWHQGRSEYGPRALGNRSILCNPAYDNKELLNTKVKFREHWRPYAAVIMQEHMHDWVDIPREMSEYMLFAGHVKSDKRSLVPGITHKDNSCRMQSVTPEQNDRLYKLLKAFEQKTQIPMLLNTSFNTKPGEPIVELPGDAISSFVHSSIDLLIINNFVITKSET